MKNSKFKKYVKEFNSLNTFQQRVLKNVISDKNMIKHVSMTLENKGVIVCVYCKKDDVWLYGKRNDLQRYKCKSCKKTFNSLTGTPLAHLRKKGHWLDYSNCIVEGMTIRNAAVTCSVSIVTSFRWRHRFLENSKKLLPKEISGIVEGQETYFTKSEKGEKNLRRKPRSRGVRSSKKVLSQEVCLFIARDRYYQTYDRIIWKFNSGNVSNALNPVLSKDSLFCSDNKNVYRNFSKNSSIRHGYINISKGELVKKDIVHTNNVNSYHVRLKKWIDRFNGVATKYLENYLSWFRELDEYKMSTPPVIVLLRAKTLDNNFYHPLTIT